MSYFFNANREIVFDFIRLYNYIQFLMSPGNSLFSVSNQCVNTRTTDTLIKLLTYFFYLLIYRGRPNELSYKPAFSKHYYTSGTVFETCVFRKRRSHVDRGLKHRKKSHFSRISECVCTWPELRLGVIRMLMMLSHLVLLLSSV